MRDDRKDGYGGVIIVYKKHLMVEEITTNYNDGDFASIKICACYRSPNNNNNNNDNLVKSICQDLKTAQYG